MSYQVRELHHHPKDQGVLSVCGGILVTMMEAEAGCEGGRQEVGRLLRKLEPTHMMQGPEPRQML